MQFYIAVFCCNLIIPLVMVVGGYAMYMKPPKRINHIIGFRTKMSMKNDDTWKFAHERCGKLWFKIGIILLIASAVIQMPFVRSDDFTLDVLTLTLETVQLIVLIVSALSVEKKLKKTFDENGNRR